MVIPHSEMDFEPHVEEENKDRYLNFYNKEIKEKSVELSEVKSKLQQVENSIKDITKEDGSVGKQVRSVGQQFKQLKEENRKKTLKIEAFLSKIKQLKSQLSLQQHELKKRDQSILNLKKRLQVVDKVARARSVRIGASAITNQENHLKDHNILNELADRYTFKEIKLKTYMEKIEQIMKNVFTDRKAAFLLDQIKLYQTKAPKYSDTTLQECIMWEDSDPNGYQFVRDSDLLTLPSPGTMKKNLGLLPVEEVLEDDSSIAETSVVQKSEICAEIISISGAGNDVILNSCDESSSVIISDAYHMCDGNEFLGDSCDESRPTISEAIHMSDDDIGHSTQLMVPQIIHVTDDGYIHLDDQEIELTFDS